MLITSLILPGAIRTRHSGKRCNEVGVETLRLNFDFNERILTEYEFSSVLSGDARDRLLTWHQVAEADGRHRYEAEVEPVEEVPAVLPQHEHTSAAGEVQEKQSDRGTSACKETTVCGQPRLRKSQSELNSPSDRRPVAFDGTHASFARNGSLDFNVNAICTTAPANSLPKSAITIRVSGIPMKAKRMQKILPQSVEGTTLPYPDMKEKSGVISTFYFRFGHFC